MIPIISLLVVVTVSILITRVATIALIHTGLSRDTARFQARSAFTGAGFTTNESERMVNHPVRRRIVQLLMLLGNAGIVTAVSSLILTFVGSGGGSVMPKVALLVLGLTALWALAMSAWVDRHLSHLIDWALRRYSSLDVHDYASLMHLAGEYRLVELGVQEQDWMAERTLGESELRDEGIVVLGITRADGTYLGAPNGDTRIVPGDTLIAYGRIEALERVDERRRDRRGDREHERAVAEHERESHEEREEDPAADDPTRRNAD